MESNMLPEIFRQRVRQQLGEEGWQAFLASFQNPPYNGLRINTLKGKQEDLLKLLNFPLEQVPWTKDGYYYPADLRPAKLPYYQAGLYYLQEPSAMSSAALLEPVPGDFVLDLCAAPGGKSTQIAAALQGQGLLVANDNSPKRVKALVWNLEHWGVTNYLVLQEDPRNMTGAFSEFFDKVLVDAPCSGEGMFRKDPKAAASWQAFSGEVCRKMQDDILQSAAVMLKPGGRLLYSTCTFNPLENEEAISAFLEAHPDFKLLDLPLYAGWQPGPMLPQTRQLWPHLVKGEGHFVALLQKSGAAAASRKRTFTEKKVKELEPFYRFMAEYLTEPLPGPFALYDKHVYQVNPCLPDLKGLKVAKPGWYLGVLKGSNFEPSQAMAMGLKSEQFKQCLHLPADSPLVERYLKCETLMLEGPKGWTLVTLEGYPLGFGKQTDNFLKNNYPPGWRIT